MGTIAPERKSMRCEYWASEWKICKGRSERDGAKVSASFVHL